jgi:signal peptidase II
MIFYGIALVVFLLDQLTKWVIARTLELHETIRVIGDFFLITHLRNTGAAFGILKEQRWFFLVITIIVVAGIIWYMQKSLKCGHKFLAFALSLILGGAAGNFVDRALYGEVVDFLQFNFSFEFNGTDLDYTYPIFNIADIGIVLGVILIFVDTIREWRTEKKRSVLNES